MISLIELDKELSLDIADDGHGFTTTGGNGSGLRNMSERLSAVGGRLALGPAQHSSRNSHRGFRLTATVPASTSTSTSTSARALADASADEHEPA